MKNVALIPRALSHADSSIVRSPGPSSNVSASCLSARLLPRISAEEIALCKTELEEATGLPCRHFAFPNGDFSDREVAIIRQAGYRTARTIDPGWNGPKTDPLRLRAVPISDDASVDWLSVQVTGIPAWLRKRKSGDAMPAPAPTHGDPLPAA